MGLLESAGAILANGEKRLETLSHNISNASTPGYKRQISFSRLIEGSDRIGDYSTPLSVSIDATPGKLVESGNALDLAIAGGGAFMVRTGDQYYFVRSGQFSRSAEGTVVNAQGMVLQQAGGGDLVLEAEDPEILEDGTVLLDGGAAGMVGLYDAGFALDAGAAPTLANPASAVEANGSIVRQGFVEQSNVVLADEMIHLMANNRQIEMGAQMVRTYDQLIGQAVTTFTRSGR